MTKKYSPFYTPRALKLGISAAAKPRIYGGFRVVQIPGLRAFGVYILTLFMTLACEAAPENLFLGAPQEGQIVINNRILAKANGKAISVVDLMKKMDMHFYRQFPQFTSSIQARFQFYQVHWKHVLNELIDKELIMADAEESQLNISAGDVRQEMESMLGPNIIENLDKVGLTFTEAYQMVLADITIRRMMYFRVHLKAISQTTPQKIREVYEQIAKNNIRDNEWVYHVVTIRHRDPTKAADTANLVYSLLKEDNVPFADLTAKLKEIAPDSSKQPSVTISEELHTNEKELSDSFRETLTKLTPESYSIPIAQKSRSDHSTVVRIFYLKHMKLGGPVPFSELENKIKEKLIDEAIEKESTDYITKLRRHFDIREDELNQVLSSDFQPFILQ